MAETRETQVIEDVINESEIENPRTTEEAILAQVVAGEEVTINARTRLQKYLSQLKVGGGNPNYVETIAGTIANPWGDSDIEELRSDLLSNDCSIYLYIPQIAEVNIPATPYSESGYEMIIFTSASVGPSSVVSAAALGYLTNGVLAVNNMYTSETGVIHIPDSLSTVLTVIYHPLPEDNT